MGTPSSPIGHTILSRLLLYIANANCVRDDSTLVLVTLREKTGCQQTISSLVTISMISLISSLSLKLFLNSLVYHRNIFRSSWKIFGNCWKIFGNVRLAFGTILENLRKVVGNLLKIVKNVVISVGSQTKLPKIGLGKPRAIALSRI